MDLKETNLWVLVKKYPFNPHLWTEIVHVAESSHNYDGIVESYNGILERFPLLHIYWQKLARIQRDKTSSARDAVPIFLKALSEGVLYYSVDLWYYYCEFMKTYSAEFTEMDIRSTFEDAIAAVGMDYTSDTIWNLYINWEKERGNNKRVSALLRKVLSIPIRKINQFWNQFQEHISTNPVDDFFTQQEINALEQEINEEDLVTTESFQRTRLEKMFQIIRNEYNKTINKLSKIIVFESKIRRHYFHFKVPSDEEMSNWVLYLNSLQGESDEDQDTDNKDALVRRLFERCIIPCNLSPDIWMRYAYYFQKRGDIENAKIIIQRAEQTALQIDPTFLAKAAHFYEIINDQENVNRIYKKLSTMKTAESAISLAMYRMRTGQEYIQDLKSAYEACTDPKESACLAAYLYKIGQLNNSMKLLQLSTTEILALSVYVSMSEANNEIDSAKNAFNIFISGKASTEDKIAANRAYQDFLLKYKQPLSDIRNAQKQQIMLERQNRADIRNMRREEIKKGADVNTVLEQWMSYFKEQDEYTEVLNSLTTE